MSSWEFAANDFSGTQVADAFRVHGFALIRQVLSSQEVFRVRAELDAVFAAEHLHGVPVLCTTELLKHEPIWRVLFKEEVVGALRAALGRTLYYQNDMDVQRNSYGSTGWRRHTGWHMDAGTETGNAYLRSPDYRFAKCGLFLQDFDNGWGGGIRVKPKSHRGLFEPNPFKRGVFYTRRVVSMLARMAHLDINTFEVPTRAGDLCFFDSRLLHSSVAPTWDNICSIGYDRNSEIRGYWADIPREHSKYVIYWDACNAAMVQDFLRNSAKRSLGEVEGMRESSSCPAVFTRILATHFPEDFPESFVAAARKSEVGIATLGAEEAATYRRKLQTMHLLPS